MVLSRQLVLFFYFGFVVLFLTSHVSIVRCHDLRNGCPNDIVYRLPANNLFIFENYTWRPTGESRYYINEVVTHYQRYKDGNITVAVCYRFNGRNHHNNRPSLPKPIVDVVQTICHDSPCDAGHILPSVIGGRDIITNIIPQYSTLNRGVWSGYEKKIFERSLNNAIVMTIFEYDPLNYDDIKFLDPAVRNLFIKQPIIIRSVTFVDIPSTFIQFCGTFKNDRSMPKSSSVDVGLTLARWRVINPTVANYGICG